MSTPYWEVTFVAAFDYNPYIPISKTFGIIFGDSWQYVWPVIVIGVFQTLGAALIMSAVDRHLRTGKLSLRSTWRLINNSIAPMAVCVLIMSAISIIWRFVLFGLVSLAQLLCGLMRFNAGATLAIISVLAVGMFIIHVLIITPILYWAPIMFIYGYRFRDAASSSFRLISGKKMYVGLIVPMLLCAGLQLLVGFLQVHIAISRACGFVIILFTNVYVVVYAILTFFRISDLDRRDLLPHERATMPMPAIKSPPKPSAPTETVETPEKSKSKSQKPAKSVASAAAKPKSKSKSSAEKPKTSEPKAPVKPNKRQTKTKPPAKQKKKGATLAKNVTTESSAAAESISAESEGGGDVV